MIHYSPLEQFPILPLIHPGFGPYDFTFTNASFNTLLILIIYFVLFKGVKVKLIPSNYQLLLENLYNFIFQVVVSQIGIEGRRYFNLALTIFLFILSSNLLGMIPYNLTITSHIIVTFGLSISLWLGITLIGVSQHGFKLFLLFLPEGIPLPLKPLIFTIEFLLYFPRPISLGVRLTANMFAGHTLPNIISFFGSKILLFGGIVSILGLPPILIIMALISLELVICVLQTYVFTIPVMVYLNDVIHLH